MSFGNLSKMLKKTITILKNSLNETTELNLNEINIMKKQIYNDLKKIYSDVTINMVDEIFNRLFNIKYNFKSRVKFDDGKNSFREFEDQHPDFTVPDEYKKLENHFNKLKNLPQPAQRSKEWFDYRYNRITASDTAAAIDNNPYEPVESFILKKCDPDFPFLDNDTVFHGKKYEPIATLVYEHIYNVRVFEFGALPSEKYSFLGASPDGICSKYSLDNNFSEMLGTMLEIKCPVTRDIHTSGKIAGDICPFYYYCQVQQQLACCELDVCDFWQCKLSEYDSRESYLSDDCNDAKHSRGDKGEIVDIDNRLNKGLFLEFYPKNFVPDYEGAKIEWKGTYIMPKRLDMDESQYDTWLIKMMDQHKTLYPDIAEKYYFHRIVYWKLENSHNVSIKRDDKFFNSILPILQDTWDKITYYREHQDELEILKDIAQKRKKYIKMFPSYKIHNELLIQQKVKFLDEEFDIKNICDSTKESIKISTPKTFKKKFVVKKEIDYESDNNDFVECDFIEDELVIKNSKKEKNSIIQKLVNSKTIKHTEFSTKKKVTIKEPIKELIKPTINDDCDFID